MFRMTQGRTYHVIDLENHLGETARDGPAVAEFAANYRATMRPGARDLMLVAVGPKLLFEAKAAFPEACVKVAHGKDAADLTLIFGECVDFFADRVDRVVIASGDFLFAGLVASLRLAGVATTVVSRDGSLSRHLAPQADEVVILPEPVNKVVAIAEPAPAPPVLDLTEPAAWTDGWIRDERANRNQIRSHAKKRCARKLSRR